MEKVIATRIGPTASARGPQFQRRILRDRPHFGALPVTYMDIVWYGRRR